MEVQPEFYNPYLDNVPPDDVASSLELNLSEMSEVFSQMTEDKSKYRYAEGKWSLRELLGHMIDSERVFMYRAMCFSRGEKQALPGFDENGYASNSNADNRPIERLWIEFETLRISTLQLFQSMDKSMLEAVGTMSGNRNSVNSIGRIIVGHCRHHLRVIKERYSD
ncbi:MAG: DinB family protein [Flavobacteriales bacterium]|nr:DinB family protein [Flavobacteriales bacterium]